MLTESLIRRIAERALAMSSADQTEVLLMAGDSALTRFANSYIHQNVAESDVSLTVRAVFGKRIGIAAVNSLTDEAIRTAVERATEIARYQQDNPDFVSLPAYGGPAPRINGYHEPTAAFSPQARAAVAAVICRKATAAGLTAAGAFATSASEMAVANSLGVFAYFAQTQAELNTVIMSDTSAGYADRLATAATAIDAEAAADEAIGKALSSRNPAAIEPGEYDVILEEYAVSDILDHLAYLGFSALAVQEGRSFMGGAFGRPIVGPNISIWDDGLDPSGLPLPFDFEGVPKQRVDLIVGGVATAVCYDSATAGKAGRESTGHALPAGETFGPVPLNLFLAPGDATREQMLAATRRGIWVTRFHYTRSVHPLSVVVTGMTRDGTFLIENGELTRPLRNLRFTQGYLEALKAVEAVGRETRLERTLFAANRVPALKIARWNFSGVTEF